MTYFLPRPNSQDHRILEALASRYESEEQSSLLASALRLQWDLQQRRGELDREKRKRKHQRELTRSQQEFRHQVKLYLSITFFAFQRVIGKSCFVTIVDGIFSLSTTLKP